MYLMGCCHYNNIVNSSFSWWGAWLNFHKEKLVVSPSKWLNGESGSVMFVSVVVSKNNV